MKVVVVGRRKGPDVHELPPPDVAPGQILIDTCVSLISPGTELHYIDRMRDSDVLFPLGYCAAGIVVGHGEGVVEPVLGTRVVALGWQYALHAERIAVPKRLVASLPDSVNFEDGVFACLAATALHAVQRGGHNGAERTLVVGLGLVGQLVLQTVRSLSASVVGVDPVAMRRAVAQRNGANFVMHSLEDFSLEAYERAYICLSGDASVVLKRVVRSMALEADGQPRGIIVAVGRFAATVLFAPEIGNIDFRYASRCGAGYRDDEYVHGRKKINARTGEETVDGNLLKAVSMIARGQIQPGILCSHVLPISKAGEAYELLRRPETALGVLLSYGHR